MNLKLEQIPKRSLNVEKPDGSIVTLTLKRFPLKDVPALEELTAELDKKRIRGEIDTAEYYNHVLSLVVDNFEDGCFNDLEVEHIELISEKISELRKSKEGAQKKSHV